MNNMESDAIDIMENAQRRAIQKNTIADLLITHDIIHASAIEDAEGYDNYETSDNVSRFTLALESLLFPNSQAQCFSTKNKMRKTPTTDSSTVGRVEWQAANLHPCDGSGSTVRAWQLRVNGRVILNAVAMTDIHEAVTADDRKLIGQALAEYLANSQARSSAGLTNGTIET